MVTAATVLKGWEEMFPEGLDKSISTAIAVSSAALGFWAHRREMRRERQRIFETQQKQYADAEVKEYAAQRDFNHILKDLAQLKENVSYLNTESERQIITNGQRISALELTVTKLLGSLEMLQTMWQNKLKEHD